MATRFSGMMLGSALLLCSCGVATEDVVDEGSTEDDLVTITAPIATNLAITPSPATFDGTVWHITTTPNNINYTAVVTDASTGSPVTGGSVQFQECVGAVGDTSCPGRFANVAVRFELDSAGTATVNLGFFTNENKFYRFKYLPRGSGYRRGTSDPIRVMNP